MASNRKSIWDVNLVRSAAWSSLLKLNPRNMMGNPVMFVVEIGSVITTVLLILRPHEAFSFNLQITLWLWFTVLFANFAEAMAEGRGKAQAETLRQSALGNRGQAHCRRRQDRSKFPAPSCASGDIVSVAAGELIPGDGEIVEGVASVDESAITGESAPVIREAGGDRSAVTGGTRVLQRSHQSRKSRRIPARLFSIA